MIHSQRLKSDLILLFVAVIWGSAFVAQRVAATQFGVLTFNGLRFLVGALMLLPLLYRAYRSGMRISKGDLTGAVILGAILFAAAGLQQLGLRYTTAGNAGFITGLYVLFIPIFLASIWRERSHNRVWLAAVLAASGLFLLSTGGELRFNPGDLIELAGAGMWALHVILIGKFVRRLNLLPLAIGQYLFCGLLSLGSGLVWEGNSWQITPQVGWAVLYTGIFSIAVGYTLQAYGQKTAPPTDAALLLSMEAVFAALFGWLFLEEALTALQFLGASLMLAGILLAQIGGFPLKRKVQQV